MGALAHWVEKDGLARSVLLVLAMTTIGCCAYTWGYYEVRVAALCSCGLARELQLFERNPLPALLTLAVLDRAQGINNARTLIMMEKLHSEAVAEKAVPGSSSRVHEAGHKKVLQASHPGVHPAMREKAHRHASSSGGPSSSGGSGHALRGSASTSSSGHRSSSSHSSSGSE